MSFEYFCVEHLFPSAMERKNSASAGPPDFFLIGCNDFFVFFAMLLNPCHDNFQGLFHKLRFLFDCHIWFMPGTW
jgi:hypothetical protein